MLFVLALTLLKTRIQISGELFQGTGSFFLVDVFCLFWVFFLIRRNTDVGRNETDPGKTNIHLRGFMDTECFRAVFSKYELIHSPEVLDSK